MRPELYRELLELAGRYSRRAAEAEELTHDVLLEALRQGVSDWESGARRLWLRGALRRHAAFLARSAARRRKREERYAQEEAPARAAHEPLALESRARSPRRELEGQADSRGALPDSWRTLPPSLRCVAVLLASGLTRREVRFVLGVSEVALRQRLAQLRKRWPLPDLEALEPEETGLAWGQLRRALRDSLLRDQRLVLGAHDPDGHLLLFSAPEPRPSEAENGAASARENAHIEPPRPSEAESGAVGSRETASLEAPSKKSSPSCSRSPSPRQLPGAGPSAPGGPKEEISC